MLQFTVVIGAIAAVAAIAKVAIATYSFLGKIKESENKIKKLEQNLNEVHNVLENKNKLNGEERQSPPYSFLDKLMNRMGNEIKKIKQTFLSRIKLKLAKNLNAVRIVLENKNHLNSEIRRNALLVTCARLLDKIKDFQNEKMFSLFHGEFVQNARNLIWHSKFFDKFSNREIEGIVSSIYNHVQSKLNQDIYNYPFTQDDIYKNFWTKTGVAYKILASGKRVDPTNKECIDALEEYKEKLARIQKEFLDKHDSVIEHGIQYVNAKMAVYAGVLLLPERKNKLRKTKTENYIRKLEDLMQYNAYRHNDENSRKENRFLPAYQVQAKTNKERSSQKNPCLIKFVRG